MRTEILYNNIPVFSGLCPTPLMSRSHNFIQYGSRWGSTEVLELEGVLVGSGNFQDMLSKQSQLISGFSQNFGNLIIQEESQNIFERDVCFIRDISFNENKYSWLLPFNISLETYPSGFFSGFYGVLEPKNSISFSESEDGVVSISHDISARGFNTDSNQSNALQNAIDFCYQYSGLSNILSPTFISNFNLDKSVLKTISSSINRLNATCRVAESWQYDPILGGTGILRYDTSLNSGFEDGIIKIDINGSLQGGQNVSMSGLRTRIASINFKDLAEQDYLNFYSGNLNSTPLSISIEENPFSNSVSFNYSFDNDPRPNPLITDSFSLQHNDINGVKSATVNVDFQWRGGCQCDNNMDQLDSALANFNFYNLAATRNEYYCPGTYLKYSPVSSGVSRDRNECKISASVSFEELNSDLIPPDPLQDFQYTLSVEPAIPKYSAKPTICEGKYSIYDLRYANRAKFSINGQSVLKLCGNFHSGIAVTKCMIEQIASQIVSGEKIILTQQSFQSGVNNGAATFSFGYSWTAKLDPVFPSGVLYV